MNDGTRVTAGFRPASRRRKRLAVGLVLGALAIGGNVLVYASLDDTEPAVQVVRDVPAGTRLTADMLRTVEVDVDRSVNVVAGADLSTMIGQYAKVRLVSGSLVSHQAIQAEPLVSAGNAIVAIRAADGELPIGLRERVPVRLVVPGDPNSEAPGVTSVDGRVVGLPLPTTNALGNSVSIELAESDAALIAAADDVRIVLLVPSPDPAATGSES